MAKQNIVKILKTKYGTYSLHFTNPDGRRRRLSVGGEYTNAQRIAVRFNDWLMEGKYPERELERSRQDERSRNMTLRTFFPIFNGAAWFTAEQEHADSIP